MNRTSSQNVLVSTTPRLEGWEIRKYLGAVSAHVVAGTNIFSDIAASWRDVFGGQSKSYKKQLEQINERVVDELREEASAQGGNALVGLQIDHDQISGQSKEMFMVTASATAVKAESRSEPSSTENEKMEEPVTASEVEVEVRTVQLLQNYRDGELHFDQETWDFLIENRISDFARIVRSTIVDIIDTPGGSTQRNKHHLSSGRDYFLSIPSGKAEEHLYEMTSHDKRGVADWAVGVLEEGNMLDLDRIMSMLEGEFHGEQKPALEVLTRVDKPYYEPSDVGRLKELESKIEQGFDKRAEVLEVEESGMFSSDAKKVWQIREGVHNPMSQKYCKKTGLDRYGFAKTDTRPHEALGVLGTKIEALNRRLGRS
jgi:uncharacterized protein YbjQ (UPF0145 family)